MEVVAVAVVAAAVVLVPVAAVVAAAHCCTKTLVGSVAGRSHLHHDHEGSLGHQEEVQHHRDHHAYRAELDLIASCAAAVELPQCSDWHRQSAPNKRGFDATHDEMRRIRWLYRDFDTLE